MSEAVIQYDHGKDRLWPIVVVYVAVRSSYRANEVAPQLDDTVQGEPETFIEISKSLTVCDAIQTKVSSPKMSSPHAGV